MSKQELSDHIYSQFDHEIDDISRDVKAVAAHVAELLALVRDAISGGVSGIFDKAQGIDKIINALSTKIDDDAITIIALRQPRGVDLRIVISAIKIATILERMGDLAKNTIKRLESNTALDNKDVSASLIKIVSVNEKLLKNATKSFRKMDLSKHKSIFENEDRVDDLANQVYNSLVESGKSSDQTFPYLLAVRQLERFADYAAKIGVIVSYLVEG